MQIPLSEIIDPAPHVNALGAALAAVSGRARNLLLFALLVPDVALAAAEKAPAAPVGFGGLVQVVVALGFVLAVIGGLAYALRRVGAFPQGASGLVRVVGGVAIGQRERIVLVQVGETQLVVGVAPGEIRTLHVLDKPIAIPPAGGAGGSDFAQRLASALRRGGKP